MYALLTYVYKSDCANMESLAGICILLPGNEAQSLLSVASDTSIHVCVYVDVYTPMFIYTCFYMLYH